MGKGQVLQLYVRGVLILLLPLTTVITPSDHRQL